MRTGEEGRAPAQRLCLTMGPALGNEIEELRDDVRHIDLLALSLIAPVGDSGLDIDEIALPNILLDPFRLLLVQDCDLDPVGGTFTLPIRLPFTIGRHVNLQHALQRYDVSDVPKHGMPANRTHGLNLS